MRTVGQRSAQRSRCQAGKSSRKATARLVADGCSLLASFATSLPLRGPSSIAAAEMARNLLTRSEGTIGELAHLLTDAAIESGEEAINQRTLRLSRYAGPTERRRLFERELT
ncbi:hypothetical protein [Streptomyces kaempferi]